MCGHFPALARKAQQVNNGDWHSRFMRKLCRIEWIKFFGEATIRNVIRRISTTQRSFSSHARKMDLKEETSSSKRYKDAIRALNDLQSNSQNLAKKDVRREENLRRANSFAERVGLSHDDIDKLAVVHISGTKGKGSTCALTESLLRHHGYRTGFFSSPHLVEVRERIRINGSPISKDLFATYFWQVYDKLTQTAPFHDGEMPFYFSFLTIMAFHVFKHEEVDVAVMEVGIGGQYDSTNIIRRPVVCGVTSLGLDHTSLLGNTLDKIAWQKGGIFKPGVPAVTMQQELPALKVLSERSEEIGCPLYLAPDYHDLGLWRDTSFQLGIRGQVQEKNASLALQLAQIWLQHRNNAEQYQQTCSRKNWSERIPVLKAHSVDPVSKQGLQECRWKGRDQVLCKTGLTYYLDGAHTKESLEQCIDWFLEESAREARYISGKVVRILIFNMTGDRDFKAGLVQLKDFLANYTDSPFTKDCAFDHVVFTPNYLYKESVSQDMLRKYATKENQLNQCFAMKDVWDGLFGECKSSKVNVPEFKSVELRSLPAIPLDTPNDSNCIVSDVHPIPASVMPCLSEAVHWSTQGRDSALPACQSSHSIPEYLQTANHIQILVTGSIHLVGGVLKLVDPTINDVQK